MVAPDPTPDRALASLAIVKVNFDRGRSFVKNFLPFVKHCLFHSSSDHVSTPELQASIVHEFGLELPQAVLKTLLRRAEQEGIVSRASGTYVVERYALLFADLGAVRAEAQRQQSTLIATLAAFAQQEFDREWTEEHTRTLLMSYLNGFSTAILAVAVAGRYASGGDRELKGDAYIVHRFVTHAVRVDSSSFALLETFVKGKMLADAMYLGDQIAVPPASALPKLEVYLDGPILLFVLGHAGSELAVPYRELLNLLKRQGANLRCFADAVREAQQILDAAASKVSTGVAVGHFYGNVVSYLIRSGKTRSDIELLARNVERDLRALGVQAVDRPPATPRLTTDESRFESILKARIGYSNPRALQVDLDAVTAIHRLREGRAPGPLDRTRAVFVTNNYGLVSASGQFFRQQPSVRSIPHCVHGAAFTTLVWLRQPLSAPDLPRERIIADAYVAMDPGDQLWTAYNGEIERLRHTDAISEEEAHILRLSEESRQVLMDVTLGDEEAYTEGTAREVLERSRDVLTASLRREVHEQRSQQEHAKHELAERDVAIERRAARAGAVVARGVFVVLAPTLFAGLVFGALGPLRNAWTPLPAPVQVLCVVVALAMTLGSVIAGVSARSIAAQTSRYAAKVVHSVLVRLSR